MELKTITASEGMILTNGEAYGKSITLGKNDSRRNWCEITEEEYNELMPKVECSEDNWCEML